MVLPAIISIFAMLFIPLPAWQPVQQCAAKGVRQSSPGQNIGNQSRHDGNQQDVAQDKSGLMHKVCGGHFRRALKTRTASCGNPGKKAQTSQHHAYISPRLTHR
jgi:hypothetical protein